jgi:hypothetical protein
MSLEWNDLNPASWPGAVKRQFTKDFGGLGGELSEEEKLRQKLLHEQAAAAGSFADYGEGGFKSLGTAADNVRAMLEQHATGAQSFSRETLRQGLMQNQAAQRSFAAGASPQNAAMAARTASMNMARQGSGLAGQQSLADIAERQAFAKALADATLQQRQQELQAALGSRQNAMTGYGAGNPFTPTPSMTDRLLNAGSQVLAIKAGQK